jgi:hypothetical protein
MYPAAKQNIFGLILVTSVFTLTTIVTMLGIVFAALEGIQLIPMEKFESICMHQLVL